MQSPNNLGAPIGSGTLWLFDDVSKIIYNLYIPRSSGDLKTVVVSSSSKPFVVSIKSFGVVSANTVIVVSGIVEVVSGKVVVDSANLVKFKTVVRALLKVS